MYNPDNDKPSPKTDKAIDVGIAIVAGQLIVNLPVLGIITGALWLGVKVILGILTVAPGFPNGAFFLILIGSFFSGVVVAWLWWSYSIPRWRRWAIRNGAPAENLHRWAVITGLEFRKGNPLERTEFRPKE